MEWIAGLLYGDGCKTTSASLTRILPLKARRAFCSKSLRSVRSISRNKCGQHNNQSSATSTRPPRVSWLLRRPHSQFYCMPPRLVPGKLNQGALLYEHDLIRKTVPTENGESEVPTSPGIGVELEESSLQRATAKFRELESKSN